MARAFAARIVEQSVKVRQQRVQRENQVHSVHTVAHFGCIVGYARAYSLDKRHKTSVSGAPMTGSGSSGGVMNLLLPKNGIRAASNTIRIR